MSPFQGFGKTSILLTSRQRLDLKYRTPSGLGMTHCRCRTVPLFLFFCGCALKGHDIPVVDHRLRPERAPYTRGGAPPLREDQICRVNDCWYVTLSGFEKIFGVVEIEALPRSEVSHPFGVGNDPLPLSDCTLVCFFGVCPEGGTIYQGATLLADHRRRPERARYTRGGAPPLRRIISFCSVP